MTRIYARPTQRPTPTAELNLGWAMLLCPLLPLVVPALVVSALLKDKPK